jgi:hypothetical protein
MLNDWTTTSSLNHRKSPARNLARLVESKYGKIIDTPNIIAIRLWNARQSISKKKKISRKIY